MKKAPGHGAGPGGGAAGVRRQVPPARGRAPGGGGAGIPKPARPAKPVKFPGGGAAGVRKRVKAPRKARKWSPDSDVALCSARAVAEALRIASGLILSDDDVLGLYWSVASDGDAGISILDALTAACQVFPLAPRWRADHYGPVEGLSRTDLLEPSFVPAPGDLAMILGLDLPYGQPHAVVAHDGAWWSWGQPYSPSDFPGAVIDEAWAVQWRP